MINTLRSIMAIRGASGANRLIYYFMRIPLLGKLITEEMYARAGFKQTVTVAAMVLRILWGFLGKFAYLGLIVYWPVQLLAPGLAVDARYELYLQTVLLLSFVAAGTSNAVIMEPKRDKYICVKLMRLPAGRYMQATMALRGLTFGLYFVPATMVFAALLHAPLWQGTLLALLLAAGRTTCEALHLIVFDRKQIVVVKQTAFVWIVIGAVYLLAYGLMFMEQPLLPAGLLFSFPVCLTMTLLGLLAAWYIHRFPRYRAAVDAVTKVDEPLLDMRRMMKEAMVKDIQLSDEADGAVQREGAEVSGKSGYAYLNALFFARHKRLILRPFQRRLAGSAALLAAGLLLLALAPEVLNVTAEYLRVSMPFMIFAMYWLSLGEKACKAMFYHCDISLLRYGFYRQRTALLGNFRLRLGRIAGLNLVTAAAFSAAVNLPLLLAEGPWNIGDALLLTVALLGLAVFFSVHHLLMYYIFQPYSTELNLRNPFFTIVNSMVIAIGGMGLVLKSDPQNFALAVLLTALLYSALAFLLVSKYARRTFRLK